MKQRLIISTIGTSLLTNQINRQIENNWYGKLRDNANLTLEQTPDEVIEIITTLQARAESFLQQANVPQIRDASAELNGIYGLYQDNLNEGKQDIHWLIATDTAQGKSCANIVKNLLNSKGINNVNPFIPEKLSTASSEAFEKGIVQLIKWMGETIPGYQNQYKICFNLVGSFKSLQGYLNTIGMFYADEIIYIFEGKQSEIITIPRLPITVNIAEIKQYKIPLAMMDQGEIPVNHELLLEIPENYIFSDGEETILSTWGQLLWDQCKAEIFSGELIKFPRINYEKSFLKDYENITEPKAKIKLQKTLAKVAQLLAVSQGNIAILKSDGGIKYDRYTHSKKIDHFRVDDSQRISCQEVKGELNLRYYGTHDYVQGKEGV